MLRKSRGFEESGTGGRSFESQTEEERTFSGRQIAENGQREGGKEPLTKLRRGSKPVVVGSGASRSKFRRWR